MAIIYWILYHVRNFILTILLFFKKTQLSQDKCHPYRKDEGIMPRESNKLLTSMQKSIESGRFWQWVPVYLIPKPMLFPLVPNNNNNILIISYWLKITSNSSIINYIYIPQTCTMLLLSYFKPNILSHHQTPVGLHHSLVIKMKILFSLILKHRGLQM
jgi:hypothetical protein